MRTKEKSKKAPKKPVKKTRGGKKVKSANEADVKNTSSFVDDLGADSLDTVELIMEFEKEFNISIPDEQAETITTVGQAVAYLEEHAK